MLLKIRGKERILKRTSVLVELLDEKDKIIWMQQRKILELSEKYNTKVKEVKDLQEQLVAIKEKVELTDVGIEKVKKQQKQQSGVVSVDDKRKLMYRW
ncbi:uncharacterized protein MONOS_11901 [Monocercomonoides exilis]|uniref:uncharacterized protein n=1 Tax=Monocercomonoides exilis TaxID=2049356 RepID=UPI00355A81C2|nr:hypothetical protein MONOS_11901 [Monocercomonoides exilis]|eukprot:MONOS_11901.1-p1 / transcript=MONOS_11901.1 / gene=MONOS_11901 / organism=Monocercomonoides_exilis_PA203 / gene_product=unspecified product / transcript_product=unspecified product / location=Mono_scaffold00623:10061-10354(-) / protein_length=98 / sequence_SO=supercontig / SO=protein_coding / is_pseudo=false